MHPLKAHFTLLAKFSRKASEGQPEIDRWCELNMQNECAASLHSKDFLNQAMDYSRHMIYDPWYCHYNGWISWEIADLSHDFEGLKTRSEEECISRDAQTAGILA